MLVLTRKRGQTIELGIQQETIILLKVLDIQQGQCRLGIDAPQDYWIRRCEIVARGERDAEST